MRFGRESKVRPEPYSDALLFQQFQGFEWSSEAPLLVSGDLYILAIKVDKEWWHSPKSVDKYDVKTCRYALNFAPRAR